jgi:hypothetical protein
MLRLNPRIRIEKRGRILMRTHSKIVLAAVGGILASGLAFQSPGHAQAGRAPTIDCQFLLKVYNDAVTLSVGYGTATGVISRDDYNKLSLRHDDALEKISNDHDFRMGYLKSLPAKDRDLLVQKENDIFGKQIAKLDRDFDLAFARITQNVRDANPELKSLWAAYQDCITKQQQTERQAREAVVPPPPAKTKTPETPPINADDVIWDILMRVRTAPDPEKELKLTDEEAVALVVAMLEATEVQEPTDKPRKTRKRTRADGDDDQKITQGHDPDTSTAVIMLGTGIATDLLRRRGSGGGGGGGTPVKPGSGGCTGRSCPR